MRKLNQLLDIVSYILIVPVMYAWVWLMCSL